MNEQLQTALAELINESIRLGNDAFAFTQEQLPEVIQQLLLWKLAASLIWFFASILAVVVMCFMPWKRWAIILEERGLGASTILSIPIVIAFFFTIAAFNLQWLQIWLAPKVYLIEYASQLAR